MLFRSIEAAKLSGKDETNNPGLRLFIFITDDLLEGARTDGIEGGGLITTQKKRSAPFYRNSAPDYLANQIVIDVIDPEGTAEGIHIAY